MSTQAYLLWTSPQLPSDQSDATPKTKPGSESENACMQPPTLNHLIMILVSANLVFLTAVICALIAVTAGAFQVIVMVLEEFRQQRGRCCPYLMPGSIKSALWQLHWLSGATWTRRSFCQPAWASHATYSDLYLRDIAPLTEDLHRLGLFLLLSALHAPRSPIVGIFWRSCVLLTYANSSSEA